MALNEEVKTTSEQVAKPDKGDKSYKGKHQGKRYLFPKSTGYRIILILMALIAISFMMAIIVFDVLPTDLTFVLIIVMLAMLVASSILFASKRRFGRILGILLAIVFAASFGLVTGYMGNTYAMFNRISESKTSEVSGPPARHLNVTEESFNVYITGIDQWASEKGLDLERSDVNMLVTINPVSKTILLTSIPRDTYVMLHTMQAMDKLTHTGVYGVDETIYTVEDWLGIDINYYVKMNFTGVRDLIDAMGGVDVYSPVEFQSSIKGYRYKKGWNHLTGKRALFFARERKSFEGQDEIRVENQQRVMKAIIKKMTTSTTLLTKYGNIMDAAGDNLETNMSQEEMRELVKMQLTDLAEWTVETQKIEGEVDQDYVASLTQSMKFDVFRPSEESVKECTDHIKEVMVIDEEDESLKDTSRSLVVNMIKRAKNRSKVEAEEEELEQIQEN